jgi:hypothetical protein
VLDAWVRMNLIALRQIGDRRLLPQRLSAPRRSSVWFSVSFSAPSAATERLPNPISQPVPNLGSTSFGSVNGKLSKVFRNFRFG